jgi:hypothetical protein
MDYYVAGDLDGNSDTCLDNHTLREYFCTLSGGVQEAGNRTVRCPYGCEAGACQCGDSDGGNNFEVKGHVGSVNASLEDYCMADNRTLVEYDSRLANNTCTLRNSTHYCEGQCRDGACQRPTCSDGIMNQGETDVDCGGPSCAACGFVKIHGFLKYEEQDSGPGGQRTKPIRYISVELTPTGRTTTTDSHGYFEFILPRDTHASYGLKIAPYNYAANIYKDLDGCNEYVWFTTWSDDIWIEPTGEKDLGDVVVPLHRPATTYEAVGTLRGWWREEDFLFFCGGTYDLGAGGSAYFNLLEDLTVARSFADGHRADSDTITAADVQYPDSVSTPCYSFVWNEIDINGNFEGRDPGLIDETAIHEYGHKLEDDIAQTDWGGGDHTFCTRNDAGFAMSEGFSEWYSAFIVNKYRNDSDHWMSQTREDYDTFETPSRACGLTDQKVELGVASLLWDLVDTPGPQYPNALANETWDTIGNREDDVFKIFDKEFDNFFAAPTVCQFVWGTHGWKNRFSGHPEAAGIDPILARIGISNDC